jgi:hypothetical protein
MNVKIAVQNNELAVAGINQASVLSDIEAEVTKLADLLEVKPKKVEKAPPKGAQGDVELVEWFVKIATDPKMATVYLKALVFSINKIMEAWHSKRDPGGSTKNKTSNSSEGSQTPVTVTVSKKSIVLPAAIITIQEFLKSLGEE